MDTTIMKSIYTGLVMHVYTLHKTHTEETWLLQVNSHFSSKLITYKQYSTQWDDIGTLNQTDVTYRPTQQ